MATFNKVRKYESNAGNIFKIRLSDQYLSVTGNAEPTGALTDPNVEVQISQVGSRRKFGLNPRAVRYRRTIGTGAATKAFYATVVALTPAAQTAMLAATDATFSGFTWTPYALVSEE